MKTISIINYKGGVGKTTIAANVAAGLVKRGKRTLVIDLDPQTNLTFLFISVDDWKKNYKENRTIKSWFDSIIKSGVSPSLSDLIINVGGVDIISSHLGLIDVDLDLAQYHEGRNRRAKEEAFVRTYSYIKNALEDLKNDYDVVLFDCPPNFSIVTKNAIIASKFYLVPAKLDYLSTLGINHLKGRVKNFVFTYNMYIENAENRVEPNFLGIIANMVSIINKNLIKAQRQYLEELQRSKIPVFDTMLRENKTAYALETSESPKLIISKPRSSGIYAEIIAELEKLTDEIIEKAEI
jgi:chromosome partitioning protein